MIKVGQIYIGREESNNNGLVVKIVFLESNMVEYQFYHNGRWHTTSRYIYDYTDNYVLVEYNKEEIKTIIDKLEL